LRTFPILLLLLGSYLVPVDLSAAAQRVADRPNAEEAERAIDRLRSPYCPGFMLEVCTSYQAALLRDSIYDLAAQGMTSDELVEWMIARHGEEWRAVPPRTGAGLLAWIIPPFVLLLGVGAAVFWLRSNRAQHTAVAVEPTALSDSDRAALTAALRDWEATGGEEEV
jgi:cytochrome c-type biogenesis protein CcmH